MELDVAKFLNEIDAALFVTDCSANMSGPGIAHHCGPLVKFLRSSHPSMPILLLNERPFANAPLVPKFQQLHAERSRALKNAFDELISAGVSHVHWNPADEVIGSDGEATVDGSHPNDLGMMRYADALEPALRTLLGN